MTNRHDDREALQSRPAGGPTADGTWAERLTAFRSVLTSLGQRIHQFLPLAERYAAERRAVELA